MTICCANATHTKGRRFRSCIAMYFVRPPSQASPQNRIRMSAHSGPGLVRERQLLLGNPFLRRPAFALCVGNPLPRFRTESASSPSLPLSVVVLGSRHDTVDLAVLSFGQQCSDLLQARNLDVQCPHDFFEAHLVPFPHCNCTRERMKLGGT